MTNPGEYTGADGRRYRVCVDSGVVWAEVETVSGWEKTPLLLTDMSRVEAALDALIEQEEWVEWDAHKAQSLKYRIRHDGSDCQWWDSMRGWESDGSVLRDVEIAYRRGRETGIEDERAKGEALAREVVRMLEGSRAVDVHQDEWSVRMLALARTYLGEGE